MIFGQLSVKLNSNLAKWPEFPVGHNEDEGENHANLETSTLIKGFWKNLQK